MPRVLCIYGLLCLLAAAAQAGKYNPTRSVGDSAPAWKNLPGVDDQKHSLENLKEAPVIVVAFTCNTCPYAVDCEDRLNALTKKYAPRKVAVVAINVNLTPADLLPAMKQRAQDKKFLFPYLHDSTQQIARDYGATRTPEFFVLNQQRKIVYMGAMDDSPDGSQVAKRYLENAVDAALRGEKPQVEETIAIGCGVRYKRKRR